MLCCLVSELAHACQRNNHLLIKNMKHYLIMIGLCCLVTSIQSQTILDKIPSVTYDNFANNYNYTFWNDNFLTPGINQKAFCIQTSGYALRINYNDLTIQNLAINSENIKAKAALALANTSIFSGEQVGVIDYAILQGDTVRYGKSNTPTVTDGLVRLNSQMAEFGTWRNRRFVTTNFTNAAPVEPYFTGVEFDAWHNRFRLTFHVKPTEAIANAQLQLAVNLPSNFTASANNGTIYAFDNGNNAGFASKGGATAVSTDLNGNRLTVKTASADLVANTSYEVSLIFYVAKENLSANYTTLQAEETQVNITTSQTLPNTSGNATISYSADEGIHYLDMPRYGMGYFNCGQVERMQNMNVALENTSASEKRVRLCFQQIPNVNVVGFNSLIRNDNGDPAGLPLQVSKNWHTGTNQLFSGSWIREYTEIIVPANTTLNFDYTRTGAKWGDTYAASSHQLSIVGTGWSHSAWLEAALGSFGENVTHSPDFQFGNSNACDYRPFLVTNQAYGGPSTECGWTGNSGGMDMWVYHNENNQRIYQSQVKTHFERYSPNLSETTVSAYSSDGKLKLDYTFFLNRSGDFTRVYYKVKIKALAATSFNRFDIFQMGGDTYNIHWTGKVVYGNDEGVLGEFSPTNDGSNNYTTDRMALTGEHPWIWAGNGVSNDAKADIRVPTNLGMVVRSYKASFGGTAYNTPYFRERSTARAFTQALESNPTSYVLVPPSGITSFSAGDSIETLVECLILPKQRVDYYGQDSLFAHALATYGDAVGLFMREAQGNIVKAHSTTNTISSDVYPVRVKTVNNEATLRLVGGKNYVPIIFEGLTNVDNPKLWKSGGTCGDWVAIDQSTHGKDFWQADYQAETELFDITYNVVQDNAGDTTSTNYYYLGETPPSPTIIVQTQRNEEGWTINEVVEASIGHQVHFAPQVSDYGVVSFGEEGQWNWTGPNGFTATTRAILLTTVTENNIGVYTVAYTTPYGCTINQIFELRCLDEDEDGNCDTAEGLCDGFVQTAFNLTTNHQQTADFKTISTIESTATIASGIIVNYLAGQQITLQPGFYAPAGSNFSAIIDDCSSMLTEEIAANRDKNTPLEAAQNQLKELHVFPNPFKEMVNINYTLTEGTPLEISVYDFTGKQIATIRNTDYQAAGHYMAQWRRPNISSQGIFVLIFKTNKTLITRKMVVHN